MFWSRFVALCNEAGKSPNAVAAACGVKSSGTVTGWSKGSTPRAPILHKLADYFHVTADYLIGNVNEPYFYLDNHRILKEMNSYGYDEDQDDDQIEDSPPEIEGLSDTEVNLIKLFRRVPLEQRSAMVQAIEMTLRSQGLL